MHLSEYEVLEAFQEPYCVVDRLAKKAARAYLAGIVEGGVNDPGVREALRRSGGFCSRHWRIARELEAPALPLAILAEDLLRAGLASERPRPARCPACEVERRAEERYLQALAAIPKPRLEEALEAGPGFVCLAHWRRLPEGPIKALLRRRLEAILRDLEAFQRAFDYRYADRPMGRERDAWLRGIRALGGEV